MDSDDPSISVDDYEHVADVKLIPFWRLDEGCGDSESHPATIAYTSSPDLELRKSDEAVAALPATDGSPDNLKGL